MEQCNIYRDALNCAKRDYFKAKISGFDQKQLFQMIDGPLKVKNVQPLPSHESPLLLADESMTFFSKKIKDLKSKLRSLELSSAKMSVTISQVPPVSSMMDFSEVSVNYVSDVLEKSKTKSSILDPAPTSAISSIVNGSLSSGVFPKSLKEGVMGPTIKP